MRTSFLRAAAGAVTLLLAPEALAQGIPLKRGKLTAPDVAGAAAALGSGASGTGASGTASSGTSASGTAGAGTVAVTPSGKAQSDTTGLPQFESGMEFEPRSPAAKVGFNLEEADLAELVKVIGNLTGKRFIFGGKVRNIKASIYSPQKVTVAEAYQAFLAILETNGLTVVPHGRFLKIIETAGAATQGTPVTTVGQATTGEDRYITRLHRLTHVGADEVANVLAHFKSKDADITVYPAGNLLIITDSGANIRRMMSIVDEIDVGGAGDQVWIEPVHYGAATDLANRINEVFDLKGGGASPAGGGGKGGAAPPGGAPSASAPGGDLHVAKVLADDRTNSLVIVATERAYLRILEFLKRIDAPQTGEGEIHVLSLQHADATDLAKTIQEIITGAGGGAGGGAAPKPAGGGGAGGAPSGIFEGTVKVSADKATNSLVVTSSLRDYASLRTVIDRLDLPRRQVFIEAVIMDLSVNRSSNLGIAFHGGLPIGDRDQHLILGGLDAQKTILPNLDALQGAALGIRGENLQGSQNLFTGISVPAFGATISALAQDGDTDVLSTPHLLATDNVAAEINVGENVPLQQSFGGLPLGGLGALGGAAGTTGAAAGAAGLGALGGLGGFGFGASPQRQDVGTKIKIIPHLNESNEVRLELTEEISEAREPTGQLQVVPITKRTVQTTLVIKDQQTVVIGGLVRNRLAHSVRKIPVLGDIPVLGALFRNTTNQMQKSNLVLVLTPYIIREQADLRVVFERKMQERQEFLDRFFVFSDETDYKPPKDYSRTNGLVEDIRQAFFQVDERRQLDEVMRPRQTKTHVPSEPIPMPPSGGKGAKTGAAAPNAPTVNAPPPVRSLDRVEQ